MFDGHCTSGYLKEHVTESEAPQASLVSNPWAFHYGSSSVAQVEHIIVLGHQRCGGIQALVKRRLARARIHA